MRRLARVAGKEQLMQRVGARVMQFSFMAMVHDGTLQLPNHMPLQNAGGPDADQRCRFDDCGLSAKCVGHLFYEDVLFPWMGSRRDWVFS